MSKVRDAPRNSPGEKEGEMPKTSATGRPRSARSELHISLGALGIASPLGALGAGVVEPSWESEGTERSVKRPCTVCLRDKLARSGAEGYADVAKAVHAEHSAQNKGDMCRLCTGLAEESSADRRFRKKNGSELNWSVKGRNGDRLPFTTVFVLSDTTLTR